MKAYRYFKRSRSTTILTQEQRVKWLMRFPFSKEVRNHTISQLLKDPITAPFVNKYLV